MQIISVYPFVYFLKGKKCRENLLQGYSFTGLIWNQERSLPINLNKIFVSEI